MRSVSGFFNRRFEDVHGHVENETAIVNARLDEVVSTTRELQERVTTDLEVLSELTLSLERLVGRLEERLAALELAGDGHERDTRA